MRDSRVVALFGDSLLIDTVEASLQTCGDMGIVRVHASVSNVVERLRVLCPDLVILDSTDPASQIIISFVRDQPGVPLLCLDITSSRVIALSCEHYLTPTAHDLADLIDLHTNHRNARLAA